MSEFNSESTLNKPHPKVESLSTHLLDEFHNVAHNATTSVTSTINNFKESHSGRLETLGLIAGAAALVALSEGKGLGKIAKALSTGKAIDEKALELPSVFEKAGQSADSSRGAIRRHLPPNAASEAETLRQIQEALNVDGHEVRPRASMQQIRDALNVDGHEVRPRASIEQIRDALNVDTARERERRALRQIEDALNFDHP